VGFSEEILSANAPIKESTGCLKACSLGCLMLLILVVLVVIGFGAVI
jgi:hypothetical protein